jgi:hypothetical protein
LKSIVVIVLILGLGGYLLWTPTVVALADLGRGQTITMIGQPLFGWQSDWSRKLVLSDGPNSLTLVLFEDTGWWSGSALYRDSRGEFQLDDGMDYVTFTLCPLQFTKNGQPPKAKSIPQIDPKAPEICSDPPPEPKAPLSKYLTDGEPKFFLGIFLEAYPGIAFRTWREVDEPTPGSIDAGG